MQNMCVFFCFPPPLLSQQMPVFFRALPCRRSRWRSLARSRAHSLVDTRTDTTHAFQAHVRSQV